MLPGWRTAKHASQRKNPLVTHGYPTIGEMLVRDIGISQITEIVEQYWSTKTGTIIRVHNRIELVLNWSTVHKYHQGENMARWKGNLDKLLAVRSSRP